MNRLNARVQGWLVWLLPFVVLAGVIAWEADWGRKWRHVPVTDAVVVAQPVAVAVLPEYLPSATLATQHDIVDRALFNPTRRPAPVLADASAKRRLQPGQFVLTGTMIVDGKATAFLRESAGGKSRRVAQGEEINGMRVADVKADRVKLTLGDESEDLVLKVAAGPKTTTQPVVVTAGAPAGTPAAGGPGQGGGAAVNPAAANTLAERRRAQQAAEAAANAARSPPLNAPAPGAFLPPGGVAPAGAAVDPRWGDTDARVRARTQRQNAKPTE
jgi:hypothetical protein